MNDTSLSHKAISQEQRHRYKPAAIPWFYRGLERDSMELVSRNTEFLPGVEALAVREGTGTLSQEGEVQCEKYEVDGMEWMGVP